MTHRILLNTNTFLQMSDFKLFIFISTLFLASVFGCSEKSEKAEVVVTDEAEVASCCSDINRESLSGEKQPMVRYDKEREAIENAPAEMVFVPGGLATIGSENGLPRERPVFNTQVKAFYMDKNLVTVAEFRKFVEETGYQTLSDKLGNGIIFDFDQAQWVIKDGVNWEYPLGKSEGKAPDDHPVTMLTIEDAEAYLSSLGKRLPTEIEWEHAARGLTNRDNPYSWGKELKVDGKYMANTWNGEFPVKNVADDGFITTSPVGNYGETELGFTDLGGNVWEWTSSWFRSYADRDKEYVPGPNSQKVIRGGSFMCHESYCHGYRVSARSHTPADNNMFHIGFRGVMDLE